MGTGLRNPGRGCQVKKIGCGSSRYRDSRGIGGGETGGKLKALPMIVDISIGRMTFLLLFQCTKTSKDNFEISCLAVKDMVLDENKFNG